MGVYAFLTTKSWRIEVNAKTARKAFTRARNKLKKMPADKKRLAGKVTSTYIKFNKEGFQVTGWRRLG